MKNDPRHCERNRCNCIRSPKKIHDFNGVWTRDLAMLYNQLSYEATDVGSWFTPRPVEVLNFVQTSYDNCINCVHNWEDHSSFGSRIHIIKNWIIGCNSTALIGLAIMVSESFYCSPNMVTVRVCSKLNTSWKSVVFTNKVGKNSRYFVGVFNKTIIPLALVGYEMIIAKSYPTCTRGMIVNYL